MRTFNSATFALLKISILSMSFPVGSRTVINISTLESRGIAMSDLKGALLAFCNPLLDITARVDASFLDRYGLKENDAALFEAGHEGLFEELIRDYPVGYTPGGSGQCTARLAQWLLPKGSTVYIGCIGKDERGAILRRAAESDGLVVEYMEVDGDPTGICAVLLNGDNSRSLVAQLGASSRYEKEHLLEEALQQHIDRARLVYITGFFLSTSPSTINHMAAIAHQHGKTFAMNLSAPFLSHVFREQMLEALPYVDILFGNADEARAFAEANQLGTTDTREIAQTLANWERRSSKRERLVIITHGSDPTILARTGSSDIESFPTPHIPSEEIVDTNGAGDAFVGGFISKFILAKPIPECIKVGHRLAGIIVRTSGIVLPDSKPLDLSV